MKIKMKEMVLICSSFFILGHLFISALLEQEKFLVTMSMIDILIVSGYLYLKDLEDSDEG